MAATSDLALSNGKGWKLIASTPSALTVKCNSESEWRIAITNSTAAPTCYGEKYYGNVSWEAGPITGYVWLHCLSEACEFSVTQ